MLELGHPGLGDDVALAFGPVAGLGLAGDDLAVPGQSAERGVDLTVRQGLAAPEEGVVVALEVVAVARLALQQPEKGEGNTHGRNIHQGYTPSVYLARIRR